MTKRKLIKSGEVFLPDSDALLLYLLLSGEEKSFFLRTRGDPVEEAIKDQYMQALLKIKNGMPLQYAAGKCFFCGETFFVDQSTLIPRLDTETLIEAVCGLFPKESELSILDLCTGSGCIGISLAKRYQNSRVVLSDFSIDALKLANENAEALFVSTRTKIEKLDLLTIKPEMLKGFDVITLNPPYIRTKEIETLSREVKEFEPQLALDGGEDGLLFYRAFLEKFAKIKEKTIAFMEIGFDQEEDVKKIAKENGLGEMTLYKDISGHPRVLQVTTIG